MKLHLLFLFCAIIFISSVYSQTCCSGGIPLSNNLGLANPGKHILQFSVNYDFNNLNTLKAGSRTLDDSARKRITHSILFNTSYSFTNNFSIETLFTWVNQRRIIDQFGSTDLQTTNGVGDAVVLANYGFKKLLGETSTVTLGIGTKIPIGSYDEVSPIGITFIADLQPGSGAWDGIFFSAISKSFNFRPSTTFFSRAIYRATGKNRDYLDGLQVYEYGDEIQLFLGVSDQFLVFDKKLISPSLSFKYRNAQRDEIDGIELNNTGGNWLFLLPSLSIELSQNISILTKAELPIISNVDGTQLTPTYRFTSGLLINFNLKKNEINFNNSQL